MQGAMLASMSRMTSCKVGGDCREAGRITQKETTDEGVDLEKTFEMCTRRSGFDF